MEKKNRRGLPCPGRPKKIKGSGLVSGRSGRRRLLPAAFSAARFAPRPPQSLAAPFRGAKSSQQFRAAACFRRPFQRRDLLPAPRKALRHRSGEQNLHSNSAPPPGVGGLFSGAICSPLPANPCAPSRGAKSSHRVRAAACHRRPFQRRDLLPAPRKPLRLRSGEQNLHSNSAPPSGVGRLFSGAICSPLLAKPCGSVPGSKIFTAIPRRRPGSAEFSAARFAPRSPQSLAAPFRGAKSSQKFRAAARGRRLLS